VRRRLALLLVALAAAFAPAAARGDDNGNVTCPPGGNCAIAVNQTDNSSLFDFAFAIKHVMGPVVDQANAAVAYSSCESCQTTAIAIEIVLVEGDTTTMSPQNVAVSVNSECTLCDTFASAYQFVITTGGPVRFTPAGRHALHEMRKEIESWGRQGLSNDEMKARLPDVIARLKEVLATELVSVGRHGHERDDSEHGHHQGNRAHAPPTPTATTETGTVETTTTVPTDTSPATTTAPTTMTTAPTSTTTTTTTPTTTGTTTTTTP
jgi:putative peptide zinc metalloprotease protein